METGKSALTMVSRPLNGNREDSFDYGVSSIKWKQGSQL